MKTKFQLLVVAMIVTLFSMAGIQRITAQGSHDKESSWKKGMVKLNETAWAGNVRLKSGMYHVKHVIEGDKHWLIFKKVGLRAGYQGGLMWEGKEVARVECRVEPAGKSLRNTKVILSERSGSARSIQAIQIAGEKVRHILLSNSPGV